VPAREREGVLVAQDGATLPAAVADALRMAGCAPRLARTTKECLAALEEQPHLACLVDASFEGGGGEQLCRTIKERRARSPLPVIMVAAHSSAQVMASWQAGADDFLGLPVQPDQLANKLAVLRAALRAPPFQSRERSRYSLLLVEPEPELRARLGALLELSGYAVLYAASLADGLRLLDEGPTKPGGVILDLDAPGGQGASLAHELRRHFKGPALGLTCRGELAEAGLEGVVPVNARLELHHVVRLVNNTVRVLPPDLEAHRRVPYFSVVEFRPAGGSTWRSGISFDLSASGLFVRTLTPEPRSTYLEVQLQLSASGQRTACAGSVAWSNPYAPRGAYSYPVGMGVQLLGLRPDVSALIARVMRGVTPGGFPALR